MKTQTWLIPLCLSGNKKQASKGRQNTVMSFPINHAYIKYIQTQQKKKNNKTALFKPFDFTFSYPVCS